MEDEPISLDYSQLYPEFEVVDNSEPAVVIENNVEKVAETEAPITLESLYGNEEDEQEIEEQEESEKKPEAPKNGVKKKKEEQTQLVSRLEGAIAGAKVIAQSFGLSEDVIEQLESVTDEGDLVSFYEDLSASYREHLVGELREDPIVDALLEFKDNGGNPLQLLDKFKQQQDVLSLDLSTEKNQLEIIKQKFAYEGLSPEKITKKIDRLASLGEDAIQEEAEEAKDFFSNIYEEERTQMLEQQKANNERIKQIEIQRRTLFEDKLKELKVNKVEADVLKANAFQPVKLKSGEVLPLWQAKAMQLQSDPLKFIDFVKYIEDPEKYKQTLVKQGVTSNTVNVFKKTLDIKSKPDSVLQEKSTQNKIKISFDK